ncbi:MAG: hypothetical protein M3Z16_09120, partial [Pseudomonadota bacterium]|nr:hypothetical protein [Pseudomonadota bacterium]
EPGPAKAPASAETRPAPPVDAEAERLRAIKDEADHHTTKAPPVTVSNKTTTAATAAVSKQEVKVNALQTKGDEAKRTVDKASQARDSAQAEIDKITKKSEGKPPKDGAAAAAYAANTALISAQTKIISDASRTRDDARAGERTERSKLDVMSVHGDAVRYREQIGADVQAARSAMAAAKKAPQDAGAQEAAQLAVSRLNATTAHAAESELKTQAYVNNPTRADDVAQSRAAFDDANKVYGGKVAMSQSIDAALPGAANAAKRAQQKESLKQQLHEVSGAAETARAVWDLNQTVADSHQPTVLADRQALAKAPAGSAEAKALTHKLAARDSEIEFKSGYVSSRLGAEGVRRLEAHLDDSKSQLQAYDSSHPQARADAKRGELVQAVKADEDQLGQTRMAADAARANYVADVGQKMAGHAASDAPIQADALKLRLEANVKISQVNVQDLESRVQALRGDLAAHPGQPGSKADADPRRASLAALEPQLSAAHGEQLRNDFALRLGPKLADPKSADDTQKMLEKRYAFFRDNPQALAGLDAKEQKALKQNPHEGHRDWLQSGLEIAGGAALFAAGVPGDLIGVGLVPQAVGSTLIAHGTSDLIRGKTTDPFIAQGLEKTGLLTRKTALRINTAVTLAASLPAGGVGAFSLGSKAAAAGLTLRGVAAGAGALGTGALLADQAQAGVRYSVFGDDKASSFISQAIARNSGMSLKQAEELQALVSLLPA